MRGCHRLSAVLLALTILGACGGTSGPSPTGVAGGSPTGDSRTRAPGTTEGATAALTPAQTSAPPTATPPSPSASPTPIPSPGEGEFINPVVDVDFPDPHVIRAGDAYYAYATASLVHNIRVRTSTDLVTWTNPQEALPELAAWSGLTPLFSAAPHKATWAPAVTEMDGRFVMYYTTPALAIPRPDGKPSQCIGVAVGEDPGGPFVDRSEAPIVCQSDLGGSIDATYFRDEDGTQYLVWKNDGNCCAIDTHFFIQELSANGLRVVGEPTDMGVENDLLWERMVIEAPTLHVHEDTYYLFYSGNDFASALYAVGYATADNVLGPYTDAPENPILGTTPPAAGPGHQGIVVDDDGDLWMTYHAWDLARIGYQNGGRRAMWIDELVFEDGRAVVLGPDAGPQAVP